jgi:hypothetical protein
MQDDHTDSMRCLSIMVDGKCIEASRFNKARVTYHVSETFFRSIHLPHVTAQSCRCRVANMTMCRWALIDRNLLRRLHSICLSCFERYEVFLLYFTTILGRLHSFVLCNNIQPWQWQTFEELKSNVLNQTHGFQHRIQSYSAYRWIYWGKVCSCACYRVSEWMMKIPRFL